jgi:hypothetical protein
MVKIFSNLSKFSFGNDSIHEEDDDNDDNGDDEDSGRALLDLSDFMAGLTFFTLFAVLPPGPATSSISMASLDSSFSFFWTNCPQALAMSAPIVLRIVQNDPYEATMFLNSCM